MGRRLRNRRDWLRGCFSAAAAWGATQWADPLARAIDYDRPVPGSERLTAYQNGSQVLVRWRNAPLAAYRAMPTQKYPYFYPLSGPVTGLSLTSESSLPYPHHRGLWLGREPLAGGDYWSDGPLERGQIRSVGLALGPTTSASAVIRDRCEWIRSGASSPLRDERTIEIRVPHDRLFLLDLDLTLTAVETLTIAQAKHSFFAMRCSPDIAPSGGGTLVNSEGGIGAAGTYGKPAAWCGFYGRRAGRPDAVEGIAIMDHPENPWSPCPWLTRNYGHLSPSPFNFLDRPWTLPRGDSIRLRYRVVLHAGTPGEAELSKVYSEWIS